MITGYKPSAHLLNDREARFMQIAMTIGIGDIEATFPHPEKRDRKILITTTGVILIATKDIIVTIYAADIDLATALYKGELPRALKVKIVSNMKKYPELW